MLNNKGHICICGGGNLGHIIAGIAAYKGYNVSLLTRKPQLWKSSLSITDNEGKKFIGNLTAITNDASKIIPQADIVLLCLPGFAIEEELSIIHPHLKQGCHIGSVVCSTGFFFIASRILNPNTSLFGFQRTPFIARINQYGQSANLLGYKKELQLAILNNENPEELQKTFQDITNTPVRLLNHFLEASLTNSNPILHPARLYSIFRTWSKNDIYTEPLSFYSSWDNTSSEILIACDNEFQNILNALPIQIEHIPTLLSYYESSDAVSLSNKIRSIKAFKDIMAPMIKTPSGYIPDFSNRYFLEDFPFGLLIIKSIGEILNINTPNIDEILKWGQTMIGKEYLTEKGLNGKDLPGTGYIEKSLFNQIVRI